MLPFVALSLTAAVASEQVLQGSFDETLHGAPPTRVHVDVVCGRVVAHGSDRATVRLSGAQRPDGRLNVKRVGDRLFVVFHPIRMGSETDSCTDLTLEVPSTVDVGVDTVSASVAIRGGTSRAEVVTVSGSVEVGGGLEEAVLETVSGTIRSGATTKELRVLSVSGDVTADGAAGRLQAETVSGSMSFTGTPRRGQVTTVSGDIRMLTAFPSPSELEISSHSGNIGLIVPADTDATFALETFSGALRVDGEAVPRRGQAPGQAHRFTRGRGATMLELTTFSGDVVVEAR